MVKPNTGLTAGTYEATVTVSGSNGISASFDVSFTVNAASTPAPATYTVSFDANGGSGSMAAQTFTDGVALTFLRMS